MKLDWKEVRNNICLEKVLRVEFHVQNSFSFPQEKKLANNRFLPENFFFKKKLANNGSLPVFGKQRVGKQRYMTCISADIVTHELELQVLKACPSFLFVAWVRQLCNSSAKFQNCFEYCRKWNLESRKVKLTTELSQLYNFEADLLVYKPTIPWLIFCSIAFLETSFIDSPRSCFHSE